MAVYMSAGRQRRRLVAASIAALAIGAILGVLIGRSTAPGVGDAISDSRQRGRDLAAALQTLPFEYEQGIARAGGESQAGIEAAVQIVVDMVPPALDKAPWLGTTARTRVTDAVRAVQEAVQRSAPVADVTAAVEDAVAAVEDEFALRT